MEVSLFREFGLIVKHGNLSEAAKELNLTQSALSRHLHAMEEEVGAELFDRANNPMKLTPIGELFLDHANRIGSEVTKLDAFIASVKGKSFRVVRVQGLLGTPAVGVIRIAKRRLEQEDPFVKVKYISPSFQTPFDLLRSTEIDVAVEPLSTMIDIRDLETVDLIKEDSYIVMESGHLLAGCEQFHLDDLEKIRFTSLRSNRDHAARKHLQDLCQRNGLYGGVPKSLSLENAETYDELFLYGLGEYAIMLPKTIALQYAGDPDSGYVARPLVGEDSQYDIRAFCRKDPSPHTKRFMELLTEAAAAVADAQA